MIPLSDCHPLRRPNGCTSSSLREGQPVAGDKVRRSGGWHIGNLEIKRFQGHVRSVSHKTILYLKENLKIPLIASRAFGNLKGEFNWSLTNLTGGLVKSTFFCIVIGAEVPYCHTAILPY